MECVGILARDHATFPGGNGSNWTMRQINDSCKIRLRFFSSNLVHEDNSEDLRRNLNNKKQN